MKTYRCILIDPPWMEQGGGRIKRGADRHYPLMTKDRIVSTIFTCPDFNRNFDGCHLWIWATNNHLREAISLVEILGFRYVTNVAWVKMKDGKIQRGLGQYVYGSHELLLFGTLGKTHKPEPKNRPPSVLIAPRTEHSRKPVEQYDMIEAISAGPRLELFARGKARFGWDQWGDETE